MTIKEGFDGKETRIRIYARDNRNAEVWIEQKGLEVEPHPTRSETLAFATLDELLDLQDELKNVIKELVS